MTTRLTKRVAREITAPRHRFAAINLVVTLAPEGVYVREKGRRTTYGPLSYGSLYLRCAEVQAYELRRERAEKRKQRRAAK